MSVIDMVDICHGAELLSAIHARISTIKRANGYPTDVKEVRINDGVLSLAVPDTRLPLIEIIQGDETYQAGTSGHISIHARIVLRMVLPKGTTDQMVEQFKACVIRCLFGNSWNATISNGTKLTVSGKEVLPRLVSWVSDVNAVGGNRVSALEWEIESLRTTHRF